MSPWTTFSVNAIGVALGIVGGILAYYLFEWIKSRSERELQKRLLMKEVELNLGKLKGFLDELQRWEQAVRDDTIVDYFGYFPLSQVFTATSLRLLQSGQLYDFLEPEDLVELQNLFTVYYSPMGETRINTQVQNHHNMYTTSQQQDDLKFWHQQGRRYALRDIGFWQEMVQRHKQVFERINDYLKA